MFMIDAHLHYLPVDPQSLRLPEELDLKLLNVCVSFGDRRKQQAEVYRRLTAEHPTHYAWCTSFDLSDFGQPAYTDRVIAQLEEDFTKGGAVGCKIWKAVGMELKDANGRYVMPDNPVFDPIYAHLARRGWTLLAHIAEPLACWQPLNPDSPHYGYYRDNPQWHMHGRSDMPSHAQLTAARDRVLAKHPTLRVIGAHLASLEYDLDEIAARLDRYPNFAIDTSARLGDLARHPRPKLQQFFTRYQDRILWGTDVGIWDKDMAAALRWLRENYAVERAFYETDRSLQIAGRQVQGLALPPAILEKVFVTNARRWYPGL
jgi:predicted TIM-barrel fold metal-dependent hydrolase